MNHTSSYALPFVPQDLKWYEKDKLMTWYDQGKCKDFLQDLDSHFENSNIINLHIINKQDRDEEICQTTLKNYQAI